MAKALLLVCWLLLLCALVSAQQAGLKDFTVVESRVPEDHVPGPPVGACPDVKTHISNSPPKTAGVDTPNDQLEFTIAQISPLKIGGDFTATVRLKNLGPKPLMVPWETDGERVTRTSENGQEESYEATDLGLILKSTDLKPIWLDAGAVLFSHPDLQSSYLEVPTGHWVDIRLKGKVQCSEEGLPCGKLVPDPHATLTAWWYQRELTHQVHDCNDDHGNAVVRELDSKPLPVMVQGVPAAPKEKKRAPSEDRKAPQTQSVVSTFR